MMWKRTWKVSCADVMGGFQSKESRYKKQIKDWKGDHSCRCGMPWTMLAMVPCAQRHMVVPMMDFLQATQMVWEVIQDSVFYQYTREV